MDKTLPLPGAHAELPALVAHSIHAAMDCAMACTACADACLSEPTSDRLRACIRLCLDCAEICLATASVATRRTGPQRQLEQELLAVCATACHLCGEECQRHASHHDHCRACAETCQTCAEACQRAMGEVM